jgi:hypothetical protein
LRKSIDPTVRQSLASLQFQLLQLLASLPDHTKRIIINTATLPVAL